MISPRSYFAFTPLLNSAASGTLEFRTAIEPVRNKRSPHIEFMQGWADDIDFYAQKVTVEENLLEKGRSTIPVGDGRVDGANKIEKEKSRLEVARQKGRLWQVDYDKLVIAVGCYSNTFGTPGVKEHAFFLKDIGGARAIRKRILECFEIASLPTTHPELRKQLLHFAIVGGGPTGMEFAAELSDLIHGDLVRFYPSCRSYIKITVYDVAERVLSMFDKHLVDYAMRTYKREGIDIKTMHHVEELRPGLPKAVLERFNELKDTEGCYTLKTKEDGETGIGLCLWSTGNMMNPFVQGNLNQIQKLPRDAKLIGGSNPTEQDQWHIKKDPKVGALLVDRNLRLQLATNSQTPKQATVPSVFALGDNAMLEHTSLPVTAQTANQQAVWLGKRLNKGDFDSQPGFKFKNLGIMTYLGSEKGLLQRDSGPAKGIRGFFAFLIWRGAYLTMSVSWRNKILIPLYWSVLDK